MRAAGTDISDTFHLRMVGPASSNSRLLEHVEGRQRSLLGLSTAMADIILAAVHHSFLLLSQTLQSTRAHESDHGGTRQAVRSISTHMTDAHSEQTSKHSRSHEALHSMSSALALVSNDLELNRQWGPRCLINRHALVWKRRAT